jgi:hypothetical protein
MWSTLPGTRCGSSRASSDRAKVRLLDEPDSSHIPQTGAVSSTQRAEVELAESVLAELWKPSQLERLARSYWAHLRRISLGALRVVYEPDARTVVFLVQPLALLRFRAPEYETTGDLAAVTWRIDRGLLVAKGGRGSGHLRIAVRRLGATGPGMARLGVSAEVQNFYPWLRGSGRLSRLGAWVYAQTQMRIHVFVTRGFLRSLARLDLPE